MADIAQLVHGPGARTEILSAEEAAAQALQFTSLNGVRYATFGNLEEARSPLDLPAGLPRLVQTVPATMAPALAQTIFYFVPQVLTVGTGNEDLDRRNQPAFVTTAYSAEFADRAICHRTVHLGGHEGVFLSSRLHADRFALAFEFFINVAHGFVDIAGVPARFSELVWKQVQDEVRGETSQDAWEHRTKAVAGDEKARTSYQETAFIDTLAIYQLALHLDFDYADLREREYPLLVPAALAARLRLAAELLPPNKGYSFEIRYRRRDGR